MRIIRNGEVGLVINGEAGLGFNGGAVSLDSQGCESLDGIPTMNRESRSDSIGPFVPSDVAMAHGANPITEANNATAPPFPMRRDTMTRGLHPWLTNTIAPRLNDPIPSLRDSNTFHVKRPRCTMPSTHSNLLIHVVFSTKNRIKLISDDWQKELFAYIGGAVHEHKANLLEAGGVEDHVHLLVRIHASFAIADTVRLIKANSSRWINEERKINGKFEWQKGYGVFSVSQSGRDALTQYIRNQREHHSKQTFELEYLRTLELHGVEYNPEYVFDEEITA